MATHLSQVISTARRVGFRCYFFFHFDRFRDLFFERMSSCIFRMKGAVLGIKIGKNIRVTGPILIRRGLGQVEIGNNCVFVSSSRRATGAGVYDPVRIRVSMEHAKVIFKNGSGMTGGSITCRSGRIEIGENSMIGPNCVFMNSDFHPLWPPDQRNHYPGTELDADIIVGDNVWIGGNCIVLKGAEIGENSIVCAGSIVSAKVPANCMVSGNPARVIKKFVTEAATP